MSNVKKIFTEINKTLLSAKKDGKLDTKIYDELFILMESKKSGIPNFIKDETGKVISIKCYYFKLWLPVSEFGVKKSSPSGYASTSKEGTKFWNSQLREFKKSKDELFDKVSEGKIPASQLKSKLVELEKVRSEIKPSKVKGYKTPEEFLKSVK